MHWKMEVQMIDVAAVTVNCGPGVENYHVSDRCYVTGNHNVIRLILLLWFSVREPTCM